jgi:hypothetical protein
MRFFLSFCKRKAMTKCKLCPHVAPSFEKLKNHWRAEHTKQYVAVQTWLADVDEAIVVAEVMIKGLDEDEDEKVS